MYFGNRFFLILIYLLFISLFTLVIELSHSVITFLAYFGAEDKPEAFDYIVVGSGSAGSIVALRLSSDKNIKVLVLEAGIDAGSWLDIPSIGLMLQKTSYDWKYSTVPQKEACWALENNISHWPMGKIVGGSGMLNNMIYVRGHQDDFNEWFASKENYSYVSDILPYFKKLEFNSDDLTHSGMVHLSNLTYTSILPDFALTGGQSLGLPILENTINSQIGIGVPLANTLNGERWTPAKKLKRTNRFNLFLKHGRTVEKVLFRDDYQAYGVKYNYLGKSYLASATKGVILSAGTIGTPKILMLSGIGKIEHLSEMKIKTIKNLPVGDNLQDHVTTGFDLILLNQSLDVSIENMLSPSAVISYFQKGLGPWTTIGCEAIAFWHSKMSESKRPDLQFMLMPLAIKEDEGVYLRKLMGITDKVWDNYFALNKEAAITLLPVLLHPKSRGIVRLRSNNPMDHALIDPQYLTEQQDVEVLLRGIEFIKHFVETEEMKKLGAKLNTNAFPGCERFEFDTKSYWECYIRHLTMTSYHPVGTCKLGYGNDPTTVIDYNFQVKGTSNLFVVDGSALPSLTSGNVNAAIMMMAEMASDRIRLIHYLNVQKCDIIEIFKAKLFC